MAGEIALSISVFRIFDALVDRITQAKALADVLLEKGSVFNARELYALRQRHNSNHNLRSSDLHWKGLTCAEVE